MNDNILLWKLRDPKEYLSKFCKIKTKQDWLQPFVLNEAQKDLFNTLRTNNRVIILKARQIWFSTAVTWFFYHKTITTPGVTTALIWYNSDLTAELLDKVKTFYRTTPDSLKPTLQYNSKFELSFPKLNSKILILPSTENVGRWYTLNYCLCTELPFWEKAEEKMQSLEWSVPINGIMVIESTPGNIGDLFHRMWMSENDYVKKEYGWWWHYTEEEIEVIRRRMNDPRKFAQEFELTFSSTGRPVFDYELVKAARVNELQPWDVRDLGNGETFTVKTDTDKIRYYAEPQDKKMYVIWADVSEGVDLGDYSVATVWDRTTWEEVAFYRGLIAPDKFAELLNNLWRKYNNALMVVEVNNHWLTTLTVLKQLMYPTLYFRPAKFEVMGQPWSDKLWWRTTKVTRPLLIDDFAQAMRDRLLTIHSKELLDEMTVFVYDKNNNFTSLPWYHDDCIFSAGIWFQWFKVLYDKELTQLNYEQHLPVSWWY